MSTQSALYIESNSTFFFGADWSLVLSIPEYTGNDYLEFFGLENPGFLRKHGRSKMNSSEFYRLPENL
jgi:hypothetical protein